MSWFENLKTWSTTRNGRITMICAGAIPLVIICLVLWSRLTGSDAGKASADRTFICSETGKPFEHTIERGEMIPVMSPHSGKSTGYPAEMCYWNKDGSIRTDPVPVLLEEYKSGHGPTFCPDCGRKVVHNNPYPQPGQKPPPTRAEYVERGERAKRD
jgi:hypothetical protein